MRAASRPRPKAATRPVRAGASPRRTRTSTEMALTAPTAAALALFVRRERDGRTRGWSPVAFTPNVRPRPGDDMPCMSVTSRPPIASGAWRQVRSVAKARCPPFRSIDASRLCRSTPACARRATCAPSSRSRRRALALCRRPVRAERAPGRPQARRARRSRLSPQRLAGDAPPRPRPPGFATRVGASIRSTRSGASSANSSRSSSLSRSPGLVRSCAAFPPLETTSVRLSAAGVQASGA